MLSQGTSTALQSVCDTGQNNESVVGQDVVAENAEYYLLSLYMTSRKDTVVSVRSSFLTTYCGQGIQTASGSQT